MSEHLHLVDLPGFNGYNVWSLHEGSKHGPPLFNGACTAHTGSMCVRPGLLQLPGGLSLLSEQAFSQPAASQQALQDSSRRCPWHSTGFMPASSTQQAPSKHPAAAAPV